MSIIGKIGREIGQEVAEGLAKKAAPVVMPAVKKPLKWGFKGRKPTDIEDLDYDDDNKQKIIKENWKKLEIGAKKNKYIDEKIKNKKYDDTFTLRGVNSQFSHLENLGVPRELTGKILDSKFQVMRGNISLANFKKGWLRYYNELDDKQKETFDILSNEWDGTIDELVDAAKLL
jgi:hypothetical protein